MTDFEHEKSVLQQLSKAREAVRKKFMLLKQDKMGVEQSLNETFKPIVTPLKELVMLNNKNSDVSPPPPPVSIKREMKTRMERTIKPQKGDSTSSNNSSSDDEFNSLLNNTTMNNALHSAIQSTPTSKKNQSPPRMQYTFADKYIELLRKADSKIDGLYGPYISTDGAIMIGSKNMEFNNNDIIIDGKKYPMTEGLLELLFMKSPNEKSGRVHDLDNYKEIMETSNAHKKQYKSNEDIRRYNSNKLKHIILPMFEGKKSGDGLLPPPYKIARKDTTFDYVYWDDPNELVDRLRLLLAEKSAGNSNHSNEIQSIIEELREAGIIY